MTGVERGRAADRRLFARLNGGGGGATDAFFRGITEFGSIAASGGAALVLATAGRRRPAADALGAAGVMWLVGQGLKRTFGRPRPWEGPLPLRLLIGKPNGTSWPSSHPAVVLAFVTVASRDLDLSLPAKAGFAALAGVVAWSRVYVGVHYPSDVAGGLLLGRAVADLWSSAVSPAVLGRLPAVAVPDVALSDGGT